LFTMIRQRYDFRFRHIYLPFALTPISTRRPYRWTPAKSRPQYAERPSGIKIYSRWNAP